MSPGTGFAPALLSSIGPLLDSVAIPLGTHGVRAVYSTDGAPTVVLGTSEGALNEVAPDSTLVRAIAAVATALGTTLSGRLELRTDVPLGVGLGVSSALLAAVAHAVAGAAAPDAAKIDAVIEGERILWGHPASHVATAAVLSTSVVCGAHYPRTVFRLATSPSLAFAVVVPSHDWARSRWKAAVPRQAAGLKAIEQAGRAAGLTLALQSGDIDAIGVLCNDRLVLPELVGQVPGWYPVERAARDAGAAAVWITGRGPSLALVAASTGAARAAAEAAVVAWRAHAVSCLVLEGSSDAEKS